MLNPGVPLSMFGFCCVFGLSPCFLYWLLSGLKEAGKPVACSMLKGAADFWICWLRFSRGGPLATPPHSEFVLKHAEGNPTLLCAQRSKNLVSKAG